MSVFFGKRVDETAIQEEAVGIPQGVLNLPNQTHSGSMVGRLHKQGTPGTVILVFIFLACFVVYYFVNWKLLSFLWKIG